MSLLRKITRRSLLVGAVAITGGAAFGIYQIRRPVTNPLQPAQGATLNPYILIDQGGISIIAPRAEMGQGVHTTLAALVAEELDAEWDSIRVLHGPPAAAYYNAALAHGALPVADYAMADWQRRVTEGLGAATRLLGLQVTGGSTSTVDAFDRMRQAGAGAREALKAVAADRLGVARWTTCAPRRAASSRPTAPNSIIAIWPQRPPPAPCPAQPCARKANGSCWAARCPAPTCAPRRRAWRNSPPISTCRG